MGKPVISIFMPVYNGELYLHSSINSIINQTFKDFELVCVDDSSTDNSYSILNELAVSDSRIRVFQKPNGGIVPKSWNYVLPFLKGDNIIYMSQDDLMSNDNLEKMIIRQLETGADCILPDMVYYHEDKLDNITLVGVDGNRDIILTNKEAVALSLKWEIHGFALWKKKIIKDEYFPEDSFDSDEYMTRKFLLKSNKVAFCSGTFFYRKDNPDAITKSYSIKNYFSILKNLRILKLLYENDFDSTITDELLFQVYLNHFSFYRNSSLRKEIFNDVDFKRIRLMLSEIYVQLSKQKPHRFKNIKNTIDRFKMFFLWVSYYNYTFFKIIMFLFYICDKNKKIVIR
jgi:glycosyltransferase involved in cell wall biosynthesis